MRWMNKDEYERWFTLKEVFNRLNVFYTGSFPSTEYDSEVSSSWFTTALTTLTITLPNHELSSDISSSDINAILNYLMTIIYNRYAKYYFYGIITNVNRDLTQDECRDSIKVLLNVLVNTMPKYIPLFIANKKATKDVLARPSSISTNRSRFNDTPQNFGDDYNDDDHTSNATYSENQIESDMGTLMTRMNEAYKNFHSITLEWSNEFKNLFLSEEQL